MSTPRANIVGRSVNGEGSQFDVPPATFGRYRVLRQLAAGINGPVFRGIDPETQGLVAITVFRMNLSPARARQVADRLGSLVERLPSHEAIVPALAAGLQGDEPFLVTSIAPGESLDVALREYGPAVIVDLAPRVRLLAEALDLASEKGLCHGDLHPRNVMVSPDTTSLTSIGVAGVLLECGVPVPGTAPYADADVLAGGSRSALSDQFALAAIAFEWLFGQPAPALSSLTVSDRAGVDRSALTAAFATALAPRASARFPSCVAFADAVSAAVVATEPESRTASDAPIGRRHRRVIPRLPLADPDASAPIAIALADAAMEPAARPAPAERAPSPERPDSSRAPIGWRPALPASSASDGRFGVGVVVAATLAGLVLGFGAGYSVRRPSTPRAAEVSRRAPAPVTATPPTEQAKPSFEPPKALPVSATAAESAATAARATPPGRLLIRSTPSGAAVSVDGTARGVTPLALQDLELGSRTIAIARPGYATEERRVVLTAGRPSRSIEVRLAAGGAGARATPAPAPRRATAAAEVRTGSLTVESRPSGATVTIGGRVSGTTPLTVEALPPGEYQVVLALSGYRTVTTTVQVAAGARARAAVSLESGQEKQ